MRKTRVPVTPICEVQGAGLWSEMAGQVVTVRGVVTGVVRRGFFIQSVKASADPLVSDALFVFSPAWPAPKGALLEVTGKVLDFVKSDHGKPVTQIKQDNVRILKKRGPSIRPVELTADNVPSDPDELATFLNGIESMLVSIDAGQTFIAPSNPYGDYVMMLDSEGPATAEIRTAEGGVLVNQKNPLRWYPGFRMTNYARAPRLNVGSKLLTRVTGPLNYRVEAFQIAIDHRIKVEPSYFSLTSSRIKPRAGFLTIMTMNGFNLDMHVESASRVKNPSQDIDDDWGDGRFHGLAQAVVLQANTPDIVALQEIQDNDGAEMTVVTDASRTYEGLIKTISQLGGVEYCWVDIAPQLGADGGQPGGSIRNGFLYNPDRVEMIRESVRVFGDDEPAYEGSRKPLVVHFKEKTSGNILACINVHLASKRHQHSIFAPEKAGHDAKLSVRVDQALLIRDELTAMRQAGLDYYVTGDFNDTEESKPLLSLVGEESSNLVYLVPPEQRYDYNHRGKLQVLMHGIVPKDLAEQRAEYDIIHGNEILGVQPGHLGDKPSDHAYVVARIRMN